MSKKMTLLAMLFYMNSYCQSVGFYETSAKSKYSSGDLEGAIIEISKAIGIEKYEDNLRFYFNYRAKIKFEKKDYYGAIADYSRVLESGNEYKEAYYKRGIAKSELKDNRGAIDDYSQYLKSRNYILDPFKMKETIDKYLIWRNDETRFYLNGSSQKPPASYQIGYVYFLRGNAKFSLKDYRGSILDYNITIFFDPEYSSAYCNRGLAKLNLYQKDSGCLDLSKAGELGDKEAYEAIKTFCQ